jgi:hypothetical protein
LNYLGGGQNYNFIFQKIVRGGTSPPQLRHWPHVRTFGKLEGFEQYKISVHNISNSNFRTQCTKESKFQTKLQELGLDSK